MNNITPIGGETTVGRVEARPAEPRGAVETERASRRGDDKVEVSDVARLLNKLRSSPAAREKLAGQDEPGQIDHLASMLAKLRGEAPVRVDFVHEIRGEIAAGTYDVDGKLPEALGEAIDDLSIG